MRTKAQSLEILTRYAKARLKNEKFVFCIAGVVNYDGKEWGIYSLADCTTIPSTEDACSSVSSAPRVTPPENVRHGLTSWTRRVLTAWLAGLTNSSRSRLNRTS